MSAWREQGFVQDSDEEEEFDISVNQNNSNSKNSINGNGITAKEHEVEPTVGLQRGASYEVDELQKGSPGFRLDSLQAKCNADDSPIVDDAINNTVATSLFDENSSPLSSPPSSTGSLSPTLPSTDLKNRQASYGDETDNHGQQSVQVLIPRQDWNENGNDGDILASSTQFISSRNFRQRKAIQLHPFLIEGEKYRTFMKARGLKPVNIPVAQSQNIPRTLQVETQDGEFQNESHNLPENPATSPMGSSASLVGEALHSIDQDENTAEEEDDLPELGDILDQSGLPITIRSSNIRKRKKPKHGKLPDIRFRKPRFQILSSSPVSDHNETGLQSDTQGQPYDRRKNLDYVTSEMECVPAGLGLPTPFTSSDQKFPPDVNVMSPEDDQLFPQMPAKRNSHTLTPASIREDSKPGSSDLSVDSDDTVRTDIKRVRKKIKGVLPASWLRLDKQAQLPRSSMKNTDPGYKNTYDDRISTNLSNDGELGEGGVFNQAIDISDDSDNIPQSTAQVKAGNLYPSSGSLKWKLTTGSLLRQGEAQEDDLVDPMRPIATRKNNQKGTPKRQTKLTNTALRPNKRMKTGCDVRNNNAGQQSAKFGDGKWKRRRTRPRVQLSILDMSDQTQEEHSKLPDFIKIARREARQLPDKGRHSPTAKSIKLHTAQDTTDARVQLHAWRAGRMKPLPHVPHFRHVEAKRPPLKEIAVNGRQMRLWASEHDVNAQEDNPQSRLRIAQVQREKEMQGWLPPTLQQGNSNSEDLRRKHKVTPPSRPRKIFRMSNFIRSAQLEKLDNAGNGYTHQMEFRHELSRRNIEFNYALKGRSVPDQNASSVNSRHGDPIEDESVNATVKASSVVELRRSSTVPKRKRPPRKLSPHRLNVQTKEYRQPEEPSPTLDSPTSTVEYLHTQRNENILKGLGGYGTIYSKDFDVSPLEPGTRFHQNTFVGSGELRKAMNITSRNLDQPAETYNHVNGSRLSCWGPWNEEVAAEIERIFRSIRFLYDLSFEMGDNAQPNDFIQISLTLRSLIDYVSTSLHFLDLIDRRLFLEKMMWLLREATDLITHHFTSIDALEKGSRSRIQSQNLRPITLLGVLASQLALIADHEIADSIMKEQLQSSLKQIVVLLVRYLLQHSIHEVSRFLEENKLFVKREAGIRDEENHVECITVLRVILDKLQMPKSSFWDVINNELLSLYDSNDVNDFERAWKSTFYHSPLDENE